eukprot:218190-Prorocentrum_minimum.AAC.1
MIPRVKTAIKCFPAIPTTTPGGCTFLPFQRVAGLGMPQGVPHDYRPDIGVPFITAAASPFVADLLAESTMPLRTTAKQ